jgi:sugar phosphate isomerase/epimerase
MPSNPLAVQSFCLRGFSDNAVVAEKVKACGLSAIELCAKHADFTDPDGFAGIVETYRQAGVEIVSIGVQPFAGDEAKERKFFESAARAGCRHISFAFTLQTVPECFGVAERLADEFDMTLGIHNHGGRHWLGNADALGWVLGQTSERIGLMLDTAWALDAGEDPIALMDRFADRLTGLHIKDFTFAPSGKGEDVVVGRGNLDLGAMYAKADEIGFAGLEVLEYEGDVDDPVEALTECVEAIQAAKK